MRTAVDPFKAIGEPTRFRVLRVLIQAKVELCACEIIDAVEKPQYAISKALGALVDSGLVNERREGRMMMYELAHSPMNDSLFQAVTSAPQTEEFSADDARLDIRLSNRSNNTCVLC
jgi:ArsR family transcriptional regulator, arsenate/arsenite/antimonite-responsive transcriptional repressor